MTSQRDSYPENCIDVVTVFADEEEEETALTGGALRIFAAAVTVAAAGAVGFGGISLLTIAAATTGSGTTFGTVSGCMEVRTAVVDGAVGIINTADFEEFRAFIAFFSSF